jgi:non-heme chloroperoxidase
LHVFDTADNPEGTDATYLEKVREALRADRPHVIAGVAPAFFGAPKNPVSDEMMQWWIRMLLQCSLRGMLGLQRMFTETDFHAEVRAIRVPTLIVHGDNDTSTPLETTGRKTAALIQGSELKVYGNAAHGLPITPADRFDRDLLAFVKA